MDLGLQDRVAVVTGASRGIGQRHRRRPRIDGGLITIL